MKTIVCTKDNFLKTLEKYWLDANYKVWAESNPKENRFIVKVQRINTEG